MIRPVAKTLLHTIAAATASAAVLLAVVLWRLSNGPISLAFLAPYVEQALSAEDASYRVNFEDFILTWAGWERTLDVRALRVQSFSTDGTLLATIPEMAVELSIAAMLRGIVAPTKLEFFDTDLSLTIGADGILSPDFQDSSADSLKLYFVDMIDRALGVRHTEHPLSYLRLIKIVESNITFHQPNLEPIWAATAVNIQIEHLNSGGKLKLDAEINLDGSLVDLAINAQLDSTSGLINADIDFGSLKPKLLLGVAPIIRHIQGIDIALNGRTSIVASTALDIKKIDFEFNGGPGELWFQELFPQTPSLIVSNLRAAGVLKPISQTLTLEKIFIDLGNTTIKADASVEGEWLKPKIKADILIENLPVSRIGETWPPNLATNAREWVTSRISHGTVEHLEVHLNINPGDWEDSRIASREMIYGQFRVVGGTVDYLPGLPVAENLMATGWYDGVDLHFNISDGHLSNQTLRDVTVTLSDIEKLDARGTIRIKSVGPINDLVQVLNSSPVQNAHVLFAESSLLKGTINMGLEVNFPLLKNLEIEELQISGATVLSDVSIQKLNPSPLLPEIDIKDLNGEMIIRPNGFDLDGTALANETPIKFSWKENLNPRENQFVTRIDLYTKLGELERKQWGINDNRLQEVIGATVTLTTDTDGTTGSNILIDATNAHLTIPSLQWSKIPGTPAKAEIALTLKNGIPLGNPTFDFSSENFITRGHVELDGQQFVKSLVFKLLEVGETHLSGRLDVEENGKYNIEIAANTLDIRPFIDNSHIDDTQQIVVSGTATKAILTDKVVLSGIEGSMTRHKDSSITLEGMAHELDLRSYFAGKVDNHETIADEEQKFPPIIFTGNIKRVLINDLMHLSDLHGEIHYDGDKIGLAEINAHLEESDNVEFRISEHHKNRVLSITSENAGAVLRALDITDDVVGGSLNLQGTFHDEEEGEPLTGELIINDFHVVNAPPFAKLLTIATLTGALELLSGKGLPFDRLQAPFVYQDETVIFDKARASGLSLGLTINGGIRLRDNLVDLNGTIIPAYILNSFVSHVPIIGDLLIGGEGQGMFAPTYRARGSFDDMEITVNPLAALAPGILRDLFKLFDRTPNTLGEER